jgi:hypothetical protein
MTKTPHLTFDVLTIIAGVSVPIYRCLLEIPRFGRASLVPHLQQLFQSNLTVHIITEHGGQEWKLNGKLHRNNAPAIIASDGMQIWIRHGKWHRDDGPAVIGADGSQIWYINDQRHRVGAPAIVRPNGEQQWFQRNRLYRPPFPDGSAAPQLIWADGGMEWYLDHPTRGMVRHRNDGPAIDLPYGIQRWYFLDQLMTAAEHAQAVRTQVV